MGGVHSKYFSRDVYLAYLPLTSTNPAVYNEPPVILRMKSSEQPYRTVRAMMNDPITLCEKRQIKPGKKYKYSSTKPLGKGVGDVGIAHRVQGDRWDVVLPHGTISLTGGQPAQIGIPTATNNISSSMIRTVMRARVLEELKGVTVTADDAASIGTCIPARISFYHHVGTGVDNIRCGLCQKAGSKFKNWLELKMHLHREHGLEDILIARHFSDIFCENCATDVKLSCTCTCKCPDKKWASQAEQEEISEMASRDVDRDPFAYLTEYKQTKRQILL